MINDYTAFFITDQVKCWRLELFNAAILENIQMVIICRSFEPQPSIDNLSYITFYFQDKQLQGSALIGQA